MSSCIVLRPRRAGTAMMGDAHVSCALPSVATALPAAGSLRTTSRTGRTLCYLGTSTRARFPTGRLTTG